MVEGSRQRGIRASRRKLDKALADAGFKTQTALATKIADLEGSSSVPKDLVNRIFREKAVDIQSLERVARALGVESHTLYLTADQLPAAEVPAEIGRSATQPEELPRTGREPVLEATRNRHNLQLTVFSLIFLMSLLAGSLVYWLYMPQPQAGDTLSIARGSTIKSLVLFVPEPELLGIAQALAGILSTEYTTSVVTPAMVSAPLTSFNIASRYQTDAVVTLSGRRLGHFWLVQTLFFVESQEQAVGANVLSVYQARLNSAKSAEQIAGNLLVALRGQSFPRLLSLRAQEHLLSGIVLLDKRASEINLKRAEDHFKSVLAEAPGYAPAQAGLCLAYVNGVIYGNEKQLLASADKACASASQMDANGFWVQVANGELQRLQGSYADAVATLEGLRSAWPKDPMALTYLARSEFERFRRGDGSQYAESAIAKLQQAADLAPDWWQAFNYLGLFAYLFGNVDLSMSAMSVAVELSPNELALTNLGTLYLCRNHLEQAKHYYETVLAIEPSSYLAHSRLGNLYFYLGDYKKSARYLKASVESFDQGASLGTHDNWGALGDSYLFAGETELAVNAYKQAALVLERATLKVEAGLIDKIYLAYYYARLHQLAPAQFSKQVIPYSALELWQALDNSVEASALLRLAAYLFMAGETEPAHEVWEQLQSWCEVYAHNPLLDKAGGVG
ncbi:tetratricopeptide repeat protein [Halioxenophilus sp. WMMB6]|uniref:tetratricopeptide repeat protein n=1 Tax=Halioxenophilus sp. WMMB6 TaxID=3073815 RepID=UPI00295E6431|nr:tetratricopeptide repeat protein [Halioxenophilus sp. WMMB6]